MPTYMDIHEIPGGVSPEDVAKAHAADVNVQDKYGVHYHRYWVNEKAGKIFCLCHAPNEEAAAQVHREAHGMMAEKIIQVEPDVAELFMGGSEVSGEGAVMLPGGDQDQRDPGIRTIFFTDIVDSTPMTFQMGDDAAMELLEPMTGLCGKHLARSVAAKSNTLATASWPHSFRRPRPSNAPLISRVRLLTIRGKTKREAFSFGSA